MFIAFYTNETSFYNIFILFETFLKNPRFYQKQNLIPEMKNLITLLAILFSSLNSNGQIANQTDSLNLTQIYIQTQGSNWSQNWDLTQPVSTWAGVQMDANGNVTHINLSNNNLNGSLSSLSFPHLIELDASSNQLTGIIPDLINSPAIKHLDLSNNQLQSELTGFLTASQIEYVDVSNNEIAGVVPSIDHLSQLKTLNISNNMMQGTIPSISTMSQLQALDISNNYFYGDAPVPHTNIKEYYITNNNFSGDVLFLSSLGSIEKIDMSHNQFSGYVPPLMSQTNLQELNLSNNNFDIIASGFSFQSLSFYDISQNALTFEDILPIQSNNPSISQFSYHSQHSFGQPVIIQKNAGETVLLDLQIDNNTLSNTYTWYKDGVYLSTINGTNMLALPLITPADNGVYTCIVTNSFVPNLQLHSSTFTVNVQLGITQQATQTVQVNVSPNPTVNQLNINMPDVTTADITIHNSAGQIIQQDQIQAMEFKTVDVSSLDQGIYFLNIRNAEVDITKQFVKL